jgi:hypothetical protein
MGAPDLTLCQVNRAGKSTFALKHGVQSTGLQLPLILAAKGTALTTIRVPRGFRGCIVRAGVLREIGAGGPRLVRKSPILSPAAIARTIFPRSSCVGSRFI